MKRSEQAQKISGQMRKFLKKNPTLKEALRVFDISYDQYQKALEGGYNFYTDTSTSPSKIRLRGGFKNK